MHRRQLGVALALALALALPAVLPAAGDVWAHDGTASRHDLVFNGEGNRLRVLDATTGASRVLIHADADRNVPPGELQRDINAQICFTDVQSGQATFVAGEDTKQGDQSTTSEGQAGWGVFDLTWDDDDVLTSMAADQTGKLVPAFRGTDSNKNENYGCGFLDNGNLLLSDVGNQRPGEAGSGQLHVWFPDPETGFTTGYEDYEVSPNGYREASDVKYCFVDTGIPTAGSIEVTQDPITGEEVVLVASARTGTAGELWGIWKYTGLSGVTAESCSPEDGRPTLVESGDVTKSLFVFDPVNTPTPNAVVASDHGTYYVSSVFTGVIAEYSALGTFIRRVLTPTEPLPPYPSSGTPLGLGVGSDGTIYYADIGIAGMEEAVQGAVDSLVSGDPGGLAGAFGHIGPNAPGALRSVVPDPVPLLPTLETTTHISDLAFPDGIGILTLVGE